MGKIFDRFGIQLWTVKDEMEKNPVETLQSLASFGYNQIETFEGSKGMFWGMDPLEFKLIINDMGMDLVSGHCDVFNDFDRKVAAASVAGLRFLVCPWLGPKQNFADYIKATEVFNNCGTICNKSGLQFAYHNHDYSFLPVEGKVPIEWMLKESDPTVVSFEMDIYWVAIAGENPIQWMKLYPNRWPIVHVKDKSVISLENKFVSTELGKGVIKYDELLPQLKNLNVKYIMTEQEQFDLNDPLTAAKNNATYLSTIC